MKVQSYCEGGGGGGGRESRSFQSSSLSVRSFWSGSFLPDFREGRFCPISKVGRFIYYTASDRLPLNYGSFLANMEKLIKMRRECL